MRAALLITSSRTWRDEATAKHWLGEACVALRAGPDAVLLSGNAKGEDEVCEKIWEEHGLQVLRFIPDWMGPCREECTPGHRRQNAVGTYCPAAGMYRNHLMAEKLVEHIRCGFGPGLCLELRELCVKERCWRTPKPHWSHGAEDCADAAEALGITTWRVPA